MRDTLLDYALIVGGILALGIAMWFIDIVNGTVDSFWQKFGDNDKSEG